MRIQEKWDVCLCWRRVRLRPGEKKRRFFPRRFREITPAISTVDQASNPLPLFFADRRKFCRRTCTCESLNGLVASRRVHHATYSRTLPSTEQNSPELRFGMLQFTTEIESGRGDGPADTVFLISFPRSEEKQAKR
ncbi:hypothetical protein Trydic_g9193 [Trypoxylus dichotomus]